MDGSSASVDVAAAVDEDVIPDDNEPESGTSGRTRHVDGIITLDQLESAFNNRGDFVLIFLSPVFFTFFFAAFASAALTHVPINDMFPSHRGLAMAILMIGGEDTKDDTTLKFKSIHTPDDAYVWLATTFLTTIFTAPDSKSLAVVPSTLRSRVATYQKIVGAIELRVFSAPPVACSSSNKLTRIYSPCHDFLSAPIEEPWYLPPNSSRDDILDWLSIVQANGSLITPSTSSLHITIPTYNGELDLLCIMSLRINFQAGGFVDTKYKLTSIPLDPYGDEHDGIGTDALVLLFVLVTLVTEFRKFRQVRKQRLRRFWSPWSIVTWLLLVAVATFYVCWGVLCWLVYDSTLQTKIIALDDPTLDVDANASLVETYVADIVSTVTTMGYAMIALRLEAMAACCLLMLRILGSLRFHPLLNVVTATLVKSLQELLPFCFVFAVCLSAFVVSGCLLFGDNVKQFSTASMAYVTVVNMLFGQFDLAQIFDVNYYFAVVWYWSAMVVLFLVLFNLLLAVVLEAFYREHKQAEAQSAPYINAIANLQRVEGPWLWPWAHNDMIALGRAVKRKHLHEATAPAIAKLLNLPLDQAQKVLVKAIAFTKIMDILRQPNNTQGDATGDEPDVDRVNHQLGEMEVRIATMVARLDTQV